MSLATDLTECQRRISAAEKTVSASLRQMRNIAPPAVYGEMQAQLCVIASESNRLREYLGVMRMVGDLEQMPPPVTTESLELAAYVPMLPLHEIRDERAAFAKELEHIGDDTLRDEPGRECNPALQDERRAA